MTARVLLAVGKPRLRDVVAAAVTATGATVVVSTPEDPAGRAAEHDLVIMDLEAADSDLLDRVRVTSPNALGLVVAPGFQLARVGVERVAASFAVVPEEHAAAWVPGLLRRAQAQREHIELAERHRDTQAILAAPPERLLGILAEAARAATRADAVLVFVRGRDGRLEPGAEARAPVLPTAAPAASEVLVGRALEGSRQRKASDRGQRIAMPTERLRRKSERMIRDGATDPVIEDLGEATGPGLVLGAVLGPPDRAHAVVWALRDRDRPPFGAREAASLLAILEPARLALDHQAVVGDLERRLAAMDRTRARMEEDARAAQVGRVAIDTLRTLQTPIAYTRTNLRFLDGQALGPDALRHLQYALDGLGRAERLLEDAQRLSEGRSRVPIEVRQLVEGALKLARPLAVPDYLEIDGNAVILGNVGRLTDALAELLRNAGQAAGASRIDVRASRIGPEVSIEVVDDGEGIADGLLERVREPFFSTRGRPGLGLTTAQSAVEAGGGGLQIWSRPGIGTTVVVTLPAADAEADDAMEIEAFESDSVDLSADEDTDPTDEEGDEE